MSTTFFLFLQKKTLMLQYIHIHSTILLVMIPHCFFIAGMCPVLCSGHGDYEDGQCRCFPGWKGLECQLRHDQCEVADCSGHGQCVNGKCVCARGYTGHACQQSKNEKTITDTQQAAVSPWASWAGREDSANQIL